MSIDPVNAAVTDTIPEGKSFEDAVKVAQESPDSSAEADQVFEKGIGMMMQTVLSPRMNEILSEAMSDE